MKDNLQIKLIAKHRHYMLRAMVCLLLTMFFSEDIKAEGTKQVAPNPTDITMLLTNLATYSNFASYNSTAENRLYININNPANEQVYFGFSQMTNTGASGAFVTTPYYFRVKNPAGTVVFGPQLIDPTTANANTWLLANTGPSPIAGPTGYTPFTYTPAAGAASGDYYIEFAPTSAFNSNVEIDIAFWDITVSTRTTPTAINGRVWARRWAFRTESISSGTDPTYGQYDRPFNGQIYTYTDDGFVNKLDFNNSGFRGLRFNLSFNSYGTSNTGNITTDRRSLANSNSTGAQFKVFLNDPDPTVYSSGTVGTITTDPYILNCPNNPNLCVGYAVSQPGLVEILLDFNSVSGAGVYDPGTADVLLYQTVTPGGGESVPYKRCLDWNGRNGLGVSVPVSNAIPIYARLNQGTIHFPVYDVEYNVNGFIATSIRPTPSPGYSIRYRYDDVNITAASGSGESVSNVYSGCTTPCHRWSNFNFGNVNTINTYWYGNQVGATTNIIQVANSCTFTGSSAVCSNSTGNIYTGPANQDSYQWSITGSGTISGSSTGQTVSVNAGVSGSFTLTLVTTKLTCSVSCNQTIPVGITASITGTNSTCANTSGLVYTANAGMDSYAWSITGNGTIAGPTNGQTVTVNASAAGSFTLSLTVTGNGGACTANTAKVVTVSAACSVNKFLYLTDPSQALDRTDPVATADNTTAQSAIMSTSASGVVVDATSTGTTVTTSATVSHTTGTGSNRLMLVGVSIRNRDSETITSLTYGGTALTQVGTIANGTNARVYIYRLLNPPSGTANVVVNFDNATDRGAVIGVMTFSGVDQTTPLGSFASATGNSAAPSVGVAAATGDLVFDVMGVKNTTALTAGSGQTERWDLNSDELRGGGSTEAGTAPTTTMSWTSGSANWAIGGVAIKPAAVVNTTTFTESPVLCSALTIPSGSILTVQNYVTVTSGTMPATPNITATIKYGSTTIATNTTASYNSTTGLLTWTMPALASDVTVPAGQAIALQITTAESGVSFRIDYDSQTKPSKITLPVSTYIAISNLGVYSAGYPGGTSITNIPQLGTSYIRITVTDPFGASDISSVNLTLTDPSNGSTLATLTNGQVVGTVSCGKIYQYAWSNPTTLGAWNITAVANEGTEGVNISAALPVTVVENTGPVVQIKDLYLSDPSQALDRTDPVATTDATTAQTAILAAFDNKTVLDNFATNGSYTGNNGTNNWSTNWVEEQEADGAGAGDVLVTGNVLSIKTNAVGDAVYRQADISTATAATLTLNLTSNTIGAGRTDKIILEISSNGGTSYTTLETYTAGSTGIKTYNILTYASANTRIRLRVTERDQNRIITFDDVQIAYTTPGATTSATFTESPTLCSALTIKAGQTITINTYPSIVSGTMPSNPTITALLRYGSTDILTMGSPTYNSGTGILAWTGTVASDVTVPAGQAIALVIATAQAGVTFRIDYDSQTKPSKVSLPVTTYIDITSMQFYSAAYPGGSVVTTANYPGTVYVRTVVTDPFGFSDITGLDLSISGPGGTTIATGTSVATSGCTRTYEYAWTPASVGDYSFQVTAKEGYENSVIDLAEAQISICPISLTTTNTVVPTCTSPTIGVIDYSVTGGNGPYTYNWSRVSPAGTGTGTGTTISNLTAGTYNITVTSAGGCTGTASVVMPVPQAPSLSATFTNITCNAGTNGSIDLTATGGTTPYFFYWQDGNNSEDRTNLFANTWSVTVTGENGCTSTLSRTLTEPASMNLNAFLTQVSCNGGSNGAINLSPTGGAGSYTFEWENAATTEDRTNLTVGTYSVVVTDAASCTKTEEFEISAPNALAVSSTNTPLTCYSNGAINITALGGTTPYTYDWADVEGTSNIEDRIGLTAGTYSVTITDGRGCTASTMVTLSPPTCIVGADDVCISNAADVFTVDPDPMVDTYTWTVPAGAVIVSGQGTPSIVVDWTATSPDEGLVCCKTVNVCGESANVCMTVYQREVTASASSSSACTGGNINLSANGGQGYQWSGPSGFTSTSQTPVIYNVTAANAGVYTVTVTDENGCTATATVNVTVGNSPSASTTVTNTACGTSSGAIDLTPSGGTTPYTYLWNNNQTTQDISGLTATAYTVTVTGANGCTTSTTATVGNTGGPTVTPTVTNILCFGNATGAVSLAVSGGTSPYTYLWSNGANTQNVSGLAAGSYTATVTDNLGCKTVVSTTVTQPNALQLGKTWTDVSCFGGNTGAIDITASGGTTPYTYLWNGGATTEDRTNLVAGVYTVTLSDANSCTAATTVTISQPLALGLGTSVTNLLCNGSATGIVNLTVTGGSAPYTYLWTGGATTEDISDLAAGSYSVTVSDANGCTATTSATVTQPTAIALGTAITNVSCNGGSNGAINLTATGGTGAITYSWSSGETTEDLSGKTAGTYTVTVTDANGCTATTSATITQPAIMSGSAMATDANCNGSATGSIDLTPTGGTSPYTYLWTGGATTEDISGRTAGTYYVTITDANSCTAVVNATIAQPAAISLSGIVTDVRCNGGTTGAINLTASGGTGALGFNWGGAVTTEDRSGLTAGTYTVTVTDGNGCTATASFAVTQPTALSAMITGTNLTCNGAGNGSANLSVSGGVVPFTYAWSNSATTEDISSLAAGTYGVTITDANGCTTTASVTLAEPSALSATASPVNVSCFGGSNGSVTAGPTGGTSPYTYAWSNGGAAQSITGVAAGNYTVTVTDANGCSTTASATVNEPASGVSTSVVVTNVACFGGSDGVIALTASGGTPSYTYAWSNGAGNVSTVGSLTAGTYGVTVTDANGCTATASYSVAQPAMAIGLSSSITNVLCHGGSTGAVNLAVTGGTAPYTYLWSNGATFEDINSLAIGTYSVTVTDAKNCTASASYAITQPTAISLSGTVTDASCNGGADGAVNLSVSGGTAPYTFVWSNSAVTEDLAGITAGNYTVIVTDANGCSATSSFAVDEASSMALSTVLTHNNCVGGASGAINLTLTGGSAPFTYTWSNGANTEDISGLTAGNYTVAVADANNCVKILIVTITQPAGTALALATSVTNPSCNGGADGAINLTVTGGATPYGFNWSNSATTEDLVNIASGTYTVTVSDGNGCEKSATVAVNENSSMALSVTPAHVACNGGATGSINLNVSGGTPGYTYNWSNGSTLQDPSGLVAGAYTVTVTDAANCNAIISTSITQPSAIQRSLSAFDETCNLNDGAVYATVSGGVAPYTFAWSNSATTQNLENIAGDTYTVTITDANSCTATASAIVGVPICIPPVAVDDNYNALINTTVTGTVASNDTDGDNTTAELTFLPLTSPTTAQGVIEWDPSYNGAFVFTPTAGFTGTVTIQYQVCDPLDLCDIGILSIYIGDTNDPPVAVFNTTTTNEDTPININILANDTDSDGNIDPTTVTITNQPDHGTVSVNPTTGELTYTPTSNYYGPDTLIYQVCDDGTPLPAQCDTAIVYIVVAPTPDITASATQTCNDNGTAAITTDDYFTIELTATNPAPGGSNQYQVYNGADLLATGTYGSSVTLNWRNAANTLRFLADGTAIYSLTIRDADNSIDETILNTTPEAECSDCPPPICPPVILTKIPSGSN